MEPLNMPPGFRFHPTDEELVMHYLMPKVKGHELQFDLIREVDLYKFEPWDLPDKSLLKGSESEWYFFSARFKKYPRGSRKNRCTECGFWKATGKDRPVKCLSKNVAMKKTLVFHEGRASHGRRTDWLMYEYRLENDALNRVPQDAVVLCRISKKIRPGLHDAAAEMSPIIQGVDDLPLTRGCNLTDELSHVFPLESASNSTLLAGYSKMINAKQKHQLEIQDPKTNLGSISAIVDTLDRMNYEPAITLLLESSDQSPGNASKIVDQPELENASFGRDEELIQELYDFLMGENVSEDKTAVKLEPFNNFDSSDEFACWQHQPLLNEDALEVGMIEELLQLIQQPTPAAEIESMLDASYVQPAQPTGLEGNLEDSCSESVDEAFAGDRWQSAESIFSELEAGDALDLLQGQSCHLETDLPLSNSPYFAVEYPTQFARPHRSFPRKLDSEVTFGIPLGAPFTHAPSSTQRSCPTIESSSQPTKASKSSPLSMFAELLDSISVPPALAAEVLQNPKESMPVMTVFSMIQQADLSSVSVCKLRNPCKNRRSIDRRACGSFSFVVLLGAFSAMFWFLLLRLAWGFARHMGTFCSLNKVFFYDSKLH